MRTAVRLPEICLAGVACFIVATLVMHAVQPRLDPWNDAVSYYMNGSFGWVMGAGLVTLGIGSVALSRAIHRASKTPIPKLGIWALALWGFGAIAGGLFPPDPIGSWNRPPSTSGLIHANAAMVAFLAFPVAALRLSARVGGIAGSGVIHSRLRMLGWGSLLSLLVFFACLAPVFSNRPPVLLGLVERILLIFYIAWLATAALGVRAGLSRAAT